MDQGFNNVIIESDSTIAIDLVEHDISPLHLYAPLIKNIRQFQNMDWTIVFHHTFREDNECADWLAKKGATSDVSLHIWYSCPPQLSNVLIAYASAMSLTLLPDLSIDEIHHQWMIKYDRTYANSSEMERRKAIFKENLEFIEKRNKMNSAAGKNYTLGLNDFSDITTDEMISCSGIMNIPNELVSSKTMFFFDDIPESIDWRERGAVTSVKRQGRCGCCWAFATMATIEGLWKIKMGELISLSAQHLIDCDKGSNGCHGGYITSAFKFEKLHANGVPSEADYPFKGVQQACRNDFRPSAGFDGYKFVPHDDEQQLLQAVAKQPVAAQIAYGPELSGYKGGIYSGSCGPVLNHAVTIVGYGVSVDGQKYWIIKNSWGEFWGESGYLKLIRGTGSPGGHCSITADYSIYPTLTL
ncbi:unnamed protein product [Trifolium pratense]|uniref:Uncharacterized protein n=1 Tax=Trifolium pratense TaxID=57577 RepID=A0ACB0M4W8_TRIPR|nr:unnamed protein product [Trifolium pratense]